MGRRLLLSLGLTGLVLSGCTAAGQVPPAEIDEAHADLTCADCHSGGLPGETMAGVPAEGCTASGCHTDAGPRELSVGPVSFQHRNHGADSTVAMGCAGCHTHDVGRAPIDAGLDACSLCHLNQQSAGEGGECRTCHQQPAHEGVTSQGLALPHQDLPWIDGACVRCHYDVTEALLEVSASTCARCHTETDEWIEQGAGEDLHDAHTAVGCLSCHEGESHRIQAMSSAVNLECSHCHVEVHDLVVEEQFASPTTCNECHGGVHVEQQSLLLGQVPGLDESRPSDKFMDGLTCRSCHVETVRGASDPTAPVRGSGEACASCHRSEYGQVLAWWRQGSGEREALVRRTLQRARSDLGGGDALDEAETLLATVVEGRAPHNLRLSHRLLQEALESVADAYEAAGRATPGLPELGTEPSMGLCSYCHYRVDEPWLFEEMSGPFHEAIGGGG